MKTNRIIQAEGIGIRALSLEMLRADESGLQAQQMAELAYHAFREPPWADTCEIPRLLFGLGVDLMRDQARALAAVDHSSGDLVAYLVGYQVFRPADGPGKIRFADISGGPGLEQCIAADARVFYVDTVCVHPGFRRRHLAERMYLRLNRILIDAGFDLHLSRTSVNAQAVRDLFLKLGAHELAAVDHTFPDRTYWAYDLQ